MTDTNCNDGSCGITAPMTGVVYRHFKGGIYRVVTELALYQRSRGLLFNTVYQGLVVHTETQIKMQVYTAVDGTTYLISPENHGALTEPTHGERFVLYRKAEHPETFPWARPIASWCAPAPTGVPRFVAVP